MTHEQWTRERVAGLVRECERYTERVQAGTEFALFDDIMAFLTQIDGNDAMRMEFHRILGEWDAERVTHGERVLLHCITELHGQMESGYYIVRPWMLVQWCRAVKFKLSRRWARWHSVGSAKVRGLFK